MLCSGVSLLKGVSQRVHSVWVEKGHGSRSGNACWRFEENPAIIWTNYLEAFLYPAVQQEGHGPTACSF